METKRVTRRKHSAELRTQVVQPCRQRGASVAAIATRNGLNANLVHRWLRQDGRSLEAGADTAATACAGAEFVPLQLPSPAVAAGGFDGHSHRAAPRDIDHHRELATAGWRRLRGLASRVAAVIRIDSLWLAVEPVDMRAGADRLLASVVRVFGAAQAHHGYLFANARSTRIRLLVHDGFGVWCAARRMNKGSFKWPCNLAGDAAPLALTSDQFDALVLGLPWQRLEQMRVITRM